MFGTEAQTELGDLKVVATKSGGRMKYIDRSADWHEADMPTVFRDVRFQGQSGKHLLTLSFSGLPLKPDIAEYGRHVGFVPDCGDRKSTRLNSSHANIS